MNQPGNGFKTALQECDQEIRQLQDKMNAALEKRNHIQELSASEMLKTETIKLKGQDSYLVCNPELLHEHEMTFRGFSIAFILAAGMLTVNHIDSLNSSFESFSWITLLSVVFVMSLSVGSALYVRKVRKILKIRENWTQKEDKAQKLKESLLSSPARLMTQHKRQEAKVMQRENKD